MTDKQSHEVYEEGEEIASPIKARERRKLIDDDDDEDEDDGAMTIETKMYLCIATIVMFLAIFGIVFLSWYCFGSVFYRALSRRRNPTSEAPTPAPTKNCTRFEEVLSYLGFVSGC